MPTTMSCPQCGSAVSNGSENAPATCPQCGTAMPVSATVIASPTILPPSSVMIPPTPISPVNPDTILPYGDLQQAAIYLGMERTLRGIGVGKIILGVILIIFSVGGLIGLSISATSLDIVFHAIYAIFGLWFIVEGIWLLVAPSATGLLVAAISMFVAGLLFFRLIPALIILIGAGAALLNNYRKYGPVMARHPTPEMATMAGRLLDKLQKAKWQKSPDIIEFNSAVSSARRLWRGLLQENLVIMVVLEERFFGKSIADIYFLPPGELRIDVSRKEPVGKKLKGILHFNDVREDGTLPPECYQRFEEWKQRCQLPV